MIDIMGYLLLFGAGLGFAYATVMLADGDLPIALLMLLFMAGNLLGAYAILGR